jgi:hypothetical protein
LTPQAFDEKINEGFKLKVMAEKHKQDKAMCEEMVLLIMSHGRAYE